MKKKDCDIVDFTKAGKYKGKQWIRLEEEKEKCRGKIKKLCFANGSCFEVKNKNLFVEGKKVYQWKGWGIGRGMTYYESGPGKYKKSLGWMDEGRLKDYKKILKPFKIPDVTKFD